MSESPFFNGMLSPPTGLNIGATLLSPDETPRILRSMHAPEMHTPVPSSSMFPASCLRSKKRQRDDLFSSAKALKTGYRVLPGENFRLQPFVVRLLEEVLSKDTTEVLQHPLHPDSLETEPEDRKKMRMHLRNRYSPVNENTDLVEFTKKLVELWGGKLLLRTDASISTRHDSPLFEFITPLRRPALRKKADEKLDDLQADELLQLDFLDEDVNFHETMHHNSTVEDDWTCGPQNLRRVTYHESPAEESQPQAVLSESNEGSGSKEKKAKASNPKRGMRWTTAERKLFLQGLERWGAGNWKSIHKIIPGRTYVQVKSMGVYLVSKFHMSRGQGPSKAVTDYLMTSTTS